MESTIKIGTRGSRLALWQANFVAQALQTSGFTTSLVVIETKGDKNLSQPFAEIGTKGIFTEELEQQLHAGDIDIAVHSAKDMQSTLAPGLELIAFTKRENPCDVLVSFNQTLSLENTDAAYIIGTSSARRRAMLQAYYPHIRLAEARGNLQTRIKKMEDGLFDGMILAYAGIHRMEYDWLIRKELSLEQFTPAVGQGSMAIEAASTLSREKKEAIIAILNDAETEACCRCERAFLRELEGGCSIPIFGLATFQSNTLFLNAGIANHDGATVLRCQRSGNTQAPESLGILVANQIIDQGGKQVLDQIKMNTKS